MIHKKRKINSVVVAIYHYSGKFPVRIPQMIILFRTSPALSIVAQLDDAIVVFEPYNATVYLWDHLQEFPVQVQTLDSIKEKRLFAKSFKISSRWLPMCVGE